MSYSQLFALCSQTTELIGPPLAVTCEGKRITAISTFGDGYESDAVSLWKRPYGIDCVLMSATPRGSHRPNSWLAWVIVLHRPLMLCLLRAIDADQSVGRSMHAYCQIRDMPKPLTMMVDNWG